MMTPFFSHGLLLLAGLCYLLSRTQATYEEFYSDTSINRFNCRKVALTISNFSISLYKEMAQESKHENILFSPVRVVASILMLSLGANGNVSQHTLEALKLNKTGLSEAEIHKCFQYLLRALNQPNEVSPLRSGSSVFIHRNLNQGNKSVEMIKNLYLSEVVAINFRDCNEAKTQINNHMMKKTNRKIMHMTKELKNDTFLAMMNYIIWNGKGDVTKLSWLQEISPNRCSYPDVLSPWHPKVEEGKMPRCVFFSLSPISSITVFNAQ